MSTTHQYWGIGFLLSLALALAALIWTCTTVWPDTALPLTLLNGGMAAAIVCLYHMPSGEEE